MQLGTMIFPECNQGWESNMGHVSLIRCSFCGGTGSFPLLLRYSSREFSCVHCRTIKERSSDSYFCNLECMFNWIKEVKVEERGLPCRRCNGTGFNWGFEQNGVCEECKGTLGIKPKVMHCIICDKPIPDPFPYEGEYTLSHGECLSNESTRKWREAQQGKK